MQGVDLENCRLALQPKEIKLGLGLTNIDSHTAEPVGSQGHKFGPRRPHPGSSVRSFKTSDPAPSCPEEFVRKVEKTPHQHAPLLLHRMDLCSNLENFPPRNKALKVASVRVSDRITGAIELKKMNKISKPSRSPRVLGHSHIQAVPSLFVEGSSMLAQDDVQTSQALKHLSECVVEERRLRDALERVKQSKLKAFRQVTRIHLSSLNIVHSLTVTNANKLSRWSVQHADWVPLARCAVVSTTLLSIIQSYMRYCQSKQIILSLQRFQHLNAEVSLTSNTRIGSLFNTRVTSEENMSLSASRLSSSLEDLLDLKEINKLKQLYFDYFECEIVELDSTGSSQLEQPLKSESISTSSEVFSKTLDPYREDSRLD